MFTKLSIKLWLLWYPFRVMAQHTPFQFSYFIATFLSWCAYTLSKKKTNRMKNVLGSIMNMDNKGDIARIIRGSFDIKIKNELDAMLYPRINKRNFRSVVSIDGLQYLDKALGKGKGVILLHSHFGNPQILMLALGYLGYSLHQFAGNPVEDWKDLFQRQLTPVELKVAKLKLECEKTLPVNFIYVFKSVRPSLRCLRNNEVVAVAIDGGRDENRVYVQFLNHVAFFSSGPIKLALKTKAEMLPLFVLRERNYKHKVIIERPLELRLTSDSNKDVQRIAQNFVFILEKYVRRYPCHYTQVIVGGPRDRFV